jgi:hypothetical protein
MLCNFENYKLLAACCIYLVIRYYERIYMTIESLLDDLKLQVTRQRLERFMATFLDTVCGQLTLPSPWHFVLLGFKQMCRQEFATVKQYRTALATLFAKPVKQHTNNNSNRHQPHSRQQQHSQRSQSGYDVRQLLQQLQPTLIANSNALATQLRTDARAPTLVYTAKFKKHCSRLLFFLMQTNGEPYVQLNNRALGLCVFRRCLLNALFVGAFDRLGLRSAAGMQVQKTVTMVRVKQL